MAEPELEAVIAVMREQLWNHLGLVLDEFYTSEKLAERWITYGLKHGDSANKIADALAGHMHEKYALEWMP